MARRPRHILNISWRVTYELRHEEGNRREGQGHLLESEEALHKNAQAEEYLSSRVGCSVWNTAQGELF